jgi:hypothetical protein
MATGSPITKDSPAIYWQQIPSHFLCHLKNEGSLGGVRSVEHSVTLGSEATRLLASNKSSSAFPRLQVRPHSVGRSSFLPSITTQSWTQRRLAAEDAGGLVSEQSTTAFLGESIPFPRESYLFVSAIIQLKKHAHRTRASVRISHPSK